MLVFSAGLGDTIMAIMKQENLLYPNVNVVSNFLKYEKVDGDEQNLIVNGFSDKYPLIHTFNKNESVLEGSEYYKMVHNRHNIILMGCVNEVFIVSSINLFINIVFTAVILLVMLAWPKVYRNHQMSSRLDSYSIT